MQYLQHSTHSAEKDMIWDGEKATFKGNVKLAKLHCITKRHSTVFRVMTWRREGQSLRQLRIASCDACSLRGHHCNGVCCATPLSLFSVIENSYVKLARMTCKQDATCLSDMKTCNGTECYVVEKVLPGSYVWFGVPEMSSPQSAVLNEREFHRYWTQESVYGVHSFVVDIHPLIVAYQRQIANGRQVVFRCGGTFMYTSEVCYVVIVTHEGDGIHDSLPHITSLLADEDRSHQFYWSNLVDENGHCTKSGYPQFMPYHVRVNTRTFWDQVVFAVHLPSGVTLSIPRKDLIGEGPLHTKHSRCYKFRRATHQSGKVCAEEEARYQSHAQNSELAGVSINELLSSFEGADSYADDQDPVVDMNDVSLEELFSSFEESEAEVQHSSGLRDHHSKSPPPADHIGLHSLTRTDTVQWVEPIGHSSTNLTRKRRHDVHYAMVDCTPDDVVSASSK